MNVALKNSRKVIGAWVQPIAIGEGIPLPHQLGAPAYRYGCGCLLTETSIPATEPNRHAGRETHDFDKEDH